jgi:adenine-specific DNA-methyltransferase
MARLDFKGKAFVQNHHLTLKYHHLVPNKVASLTDKVSLHDNLIIHGDNLVALKALLPTYAGKVKCIYIDPPYNTGNEGWVYNDNVNSPMMRAWLGEVVDRDDQTRHDKWLCMMMPRLKLLRDLLREDGVIFISIDDNEVHHLRMLMDEIFGEENFIASIIWQKKFAPQNDAKFFSDNHDYIVVYTKIKNLWKRNLLPRTQKGLQRYKNSDNDPRGAWLSDNLLRMEHRDNGIYTITSPAGKTWTPEPGTSWRHPKEEMLALIASNEIYFGLSGDGKPRRKRFLKDVQQGLVPETIWHYEEVGHGQEATQQLKTILSASNLEFNNPKPNRLIEQILKVSTLPNNQEIILDSFAGSGTTAQAVLALNKEDGGNRKFILVEMENYAESLTAERVRRVIQGVPNAKDESLKEGLGGTFSFFDLGEPIEMQAILQGDNLPTYEELARYVFYTATGEEFDPSQIDLERNYIGASKDFEVYLFYQPDLEYLKATALNLPLAERLGKDKRKLVFAPMKYLDQDHLTDYKIDYCQLPFEIYKFRN